MDSTAHGGLGPPPSVSNQKNAPQTYPQARLLAQFLSEAPSSQVCQVVTELTDREMIHSIGVSWRGDG